MIVAKKFYIAATILVHIGVQLFRITHHLLIPKSEPLCPAGRYAGHKPLITRGIKINAVWTPPPEKPFKSEEN